jgi:alkylation response protein AidB-like acyl-CoA dehydrogenase
MRPERALDLAVSHARQRVQFGRPIGSFQAIKHKCADMLVALEGARVALDGALLAGADCGVAALVAGLQCAAAYTHITAEAIQVLGGLGFTWEHPAHLYFRRARAAAVLFGTKAQHRAALADRLGFRCTAAGRSRRARSPRHRCHCRPGCRCRSTARRW